MTGVNPTSPADADMEKLAELAHTIWAKWTEWMLTHLDEAHVVRWTCQYLTPYAELSEAEKESDRKIALQWIDAVRSSGCLPVGGSRQHYVVMSLDWWNKHTEELHRLQGEITRMRKAAGIAEEVADG